MKTKILFSSTIGKRNNVTVPSKVINKHFLKSGNSTVLLLEIKNTKFYSNVSYQNSSSSLYLPKSITKKLNLKPGKEVEIKVIDNLKGQLRRPDIARLSFLLNKKANIANFDYKNTEFLDMKNILSGEFRIFNKTVSFLIKDIQHDKLQISYRYDSSKRKFKTIIIKRYIPLYTFAQFLGFYIGDGTTTLNTGSVSFINIAKDVIKWNRDFFKMYFDSKLKYRLVYGPIKPSEKTSEKLKDYWSEIGIKNFTWSINKGYKNPNKYGAMRIDTINMCLKLTIIKSIDKISKMATKDSTIAKSFLKGLAMSDMYPATKNGILESIGVAFQEGNKNSIELYSKIFDAYGIRVRPNGKTIENTTALYTYRMEDFIKMIIDGIFNFHNTRNKKLIEGLVKRDLFSRYFNRLNLLLKDPLTAYEFCIKSKISDIPYGQLERLIKFGLINKTDTYPRLYFITDRGKQLLNALSIRSGEVSN